MMATTKLCQSQRAIDAWDDFVLHCRGAHYCQLFGWLSSYEPMGFDCEVMVQTEGGAIVGGAAFLSFKIPFLTGRIFILPHGPIGREPGTPSWQALMEALDNHFQRRGAIYVQVWPPVAKQDLTGLEYFVKAGYRGPELFKSHRFSSTVLAVDVGGRTQQEILAGFRKETRKNYHRSLRRGLELRLVRSHEEFRRSYDFMEEYARFRNYSPRPFHSLMIGFEGVIKKNRGQLIQVWKDDELIGTLFLLFAGRIATSYAGLVRRDFGKFYPAEFMQISAMILAKEQGMEVYDLMNWCTEGVAEFKSGFRPRECCWAEPRTKILRPGLARCLSWGDDRLRPVIRQFGRWRAKRTTKEMSGTN